jgi:uridine phosphorylase
VSAAQRRFNHSNNPGFVCHESVLVLPFGRRSYLPAIVEAYQGEPVQLDETTDREIFTLHGGPQPISLVYSGMGGPAVANALEMAAANGARRSVVFGACGGVSPEIEVGSLIVVSGGVRGEGTSAYYAPPEFPAAFDPELVVQLAHEARRCAGVPVHTGVVYTTDASYRQGPEIYDRYQGLIVGVECECATAAVVAARLGIAVGALLFCTDNVTLPRVQDRSYTGLRDERVRRAFDQGLAIAISVLLASSSDKSQLR